MLIQSSYIEEMGQKFHVMSGRRMHTPLSHLGGGPALSIPTADAKFPHYHQSVLSSLIYIAIISRPDVAFAVNALPER